MEEWKSARILKNVEKFFGTSYPDLVKQVGPPLWFHDKSFTLNDSFWGLGLVRDRNVLYSPAHSDYFEYNKFNGLWSSITQDVLMARINRTVMYAAIVNIMVGSQIIIMTTPKVNC